MSDLTEELVGQKVVEYIEERSQEKVAESPWFFRASSVGDCMAKLVFQYHHRKDKVDKTDKFTVAEAMRLFRGLSMQDAIRQLLAERNVKIKWVEKELSKDYPYKGKVIRVKGHTDWMMTCSDGKKRIIDWKEVGHFSSESAAEKGLPHYYYDQMLLYLDMAEMSEGVVLYSSDTGLSEYVVKHSDKDVKEVLERLYQVGLARESKEPGVREFEQNKPPCTWCPFHKECWGVQASLEKNADAHPVKPKDVPTLEEAYKLQAQAKELEEKAGTLKTKARSLAMYLIEKYKKRRLTNGSVGFSWVSVSRTTTKILNEKKGLKLGILKKETSESSYPLWR